MHISAAWRGRLLPAAPASLVRRLAASRHPPLPAPHPHRPQTPAGAPARIPLAHQHHAQQRQHIHAPASPPRRLSVPRRPCQAGTRGGAHKATNCHAAAAAIHMLNNRTLGQAALQLINDRHMRQWRTIHTAAVAAACTGGKAHLGQLPLHSTCHGTVQQPHFTSNHLVHYSQPLHTSTHMSPTTQAFRRHSVPPCCGTPANIQHQRALHTTFAHATASAQPRACKRPHKKATSGSIVHTADAASAAAQPFRKQLPARHGGQSFRRPLPLAPSKLHYCKRHAGAVARLRHTTLLLPHACATGHSAQSHPLRAAGKRHPCASKADA